jgi:hypothetical protein
MGPIARWVVAASVAALVSLSPRLSSADSQTFNSIFFQPATGRNSYLMLHSTDTLHKLQFNAGEIFSYGYLPLEQRYQGQRVRGIVDDMVVADFVAAMGALDWLQFGLDFPLIIINRFSDPLVTPAPSMSNEFDIGDLRIEAKARVLDVCERYIGLAFVPFVTLPTGKDAHYVGDPGVTGGLKIALDGRPHERIGLTLNVGFQTGRRVRLRNVDFQHRLLLGGGVLAMFKHGIDVFAEINAVSAINKIFSDRDVNPAEAMVGARWDIKKTGVSVHAGGGTCLVCGVKGARVRAVLGAKYRLNTPKYRQLDAREHQVCDSLFEKGFTTAQLAELKQNCPPDPADFQPRVHDDSCPKYYEIRDLADLVIRCPGRPEDFDPKVHDPSCQKVYTLSDDYTQEEVENVYDLAAKEMSANCPADPADFNPTLHDPGCPKYYDLREAVALSGRCPDSAAAYRPGVDDPACPKFYTLRDEYEPDQWALIAKLSKMDSDRDGINDYLDRCPYEAEDINGFADEDGCPEGGAVAVTGGEIRTLRPVYFDFNKVAIKPEAMPIIDQVIEVINKTPWVRRVRVGGNADSMGPAQFNNLISRRRAEAVIDYMRKHGVRSDVELVPIAYGANRPVASNLTAQGRAQNRRVTFVVQSVRYPYYKPPARPERAKEEPAAKAPPVEEKPAEEPPAEPEPEPKPEEEELPPLPPKRWEQ